jgi:glycine hydroxymethyltransferase
MSYSNYVFNKSLEEIDPEVSELIAFEEARQAGKIILIPSESMCPFPILKALGSAFSNIYAEGYVPSMMEGEKEETLLDIHFQLSRYRRYSDRRFYKGCEYANLLEALAGRRAAALFETKKNPAGNIFVNVQPLSGSIANTVVYDAFVKPGDTVMGLSLMHGGHLTHGSEFNRSGKSYRIVPYEVDAKRGRLNYEKIAELAEEYHPKMIIAGYTSYPWAPDWKKFKEITNRIGAVLLADVSHPAGLVVAGAYPNPIDYADVTVCTTHKTLFGPRGAIIMTTNREYAERIDQAVFPGEQGGPHVNKFAAMAVAFKIAMSREFKEVQRNIVDNAKYLGEVLQQKGLKLAYGGTNTHLLLIDLKSISTQSGYPLMGETAVRILDLCGIVANKNTIPGDLVTAEASGIRMGTPWITQRGITREGIAELGEIMALILNSINPFSYIGLKGTLPRGKIELGVLEDARQRVGLLAEKLLSERRPLDFAYPHVSVEMSTLYGVESSPLKKDSDHKGARSVSSEMAVIEVKGKRAVPFLECVSTCKITTMNAGEIRQSFILNAKGILITPVIIGRIVTREPHHDHFFVLCKADAKERILLWFRCLSDGYAAFDDEDVFRKVDGPVVVRSLNDMTEEEGEHIVKEIETLSPESIEIPHYKQQSDAPFLFRESPGLFDITKPYFIGQSRIDYSRTREEKRAFSIMRAETQPAAETAELHAAGVNKKEKSTEEDGSFSNTELKRSILHDEHIGLGASMVPFAGWEMPVRYESIIGEHRAVREKAGLFDISHMGVLEVSGENASQFLDTVSSNYVHWIESGESQYGYLLDIDGNVIDDIMVYKRSDERYMVVVNAANTEIDLAWLLSVNAREAMIDRKAPLKEILCEITISDLKGKTMPKDEALIDIAVQGPESLRILSELVRTDVERRQLHRLQKMRFIETELDGMDIIVSRTGYTGEEIGYELFVHPVDAPRLWSLVLDAGKWFGVMPVGLGARDSLRTEAGLPLHGHELAGLKNISPIEAGFGPYVKLHKAFFIGRNALLQKMHTSKMAVGRFRMLSRGVRTAKPGDIVVSGRSQRMIGNVTSCAVDGEGIQIGMAYVDARYAREDVQIGIISAITTDTKRSKSITELELGDKFPLPVEAIMLSRFPTVQQSIER